MNRRIEIITIGDEVLRGETQENNGVWLSRALIHAGLEPWKITVLPDEMDILVAEFKEAAGRSEAIVVTGGLGPTVDDLTKEALIRALGGGTEIKAGIVEGIAARMKERGREMPAGYRDQERVPVGAEIIENPVGLAIGLRVRGGGGAGAGRGTNAGGGTGAGGGDGAGGGEFFLLPGVPAEMQAMFAASVLPALGAPGIDVSIRLRTFGLMETQVEDALRKVLPEDILKTISIISSPRGVDFYIPREPDGAANAEKAERELGSHIFTEGNARFEAVVVGLLIARRVTVATAESVTGGLIASTLISVPGASDTFREGFVTYSNEAKMTRLVVSPAILEAHGAVSAEVCVEMAEGVRAAAGTDYALSTTGIAGPTGAVPGKPVGLCFAGLAGPEGTFVRNFQFPGDREMVRLRTAYFAIDMLRLALIGEKARLEPFRVAGASGGEAGAHGGDAGAHGGETKGRTR
jgi:nicotinamide-nucleotide amidase